MLKRLRSHLRSKLFLWNFVIIVLVSLLAGHFIVVHGERYVFFELIKQRYYHFSVAYSGGIALLLLLGIYGVSYWLNGKYGAMRLNLRWVFWQVVYGIFVVCCAAVILAAMLFYWQGYHILETAYFRSYFGPIVQFVALANLLYLLFFLQRQRVVKSSVRYVWVKNTVGEDDELVDHDEPALIYKDSLGLWALDFGSEKMPWNDTLEETMQCYGHENYFLGQRNWMVHKKAIQSIEQLADRRLAITLKIDCPFPLIVSRRRSHGFKEWFSE